MVQDLCAKGFIIKEQIVWVLQLNITKLLNHFKQETNFLNYLSR